MVDAGYLIGLTIAPIIAAEGWREAYARLIADVALALAGISWSNSSRTVTRRDQKQCWKAGILNPRLT